MKNFIYTSFLVFVVGFSVFGQCPPNLGFEAGNLSYWSYNSGRYTGATIYEGDYTTNPTVSLNPIPAKLSTLTQSNDKLNRPTGFAILTADNTNSVTDPIVSAIKKVPVINGYRYTKSVQLGNSATGAVADKLTYRLTVPNGVSTYNITYAFAMVLQDPGHTPNSQPAFVATVLDLSQPAGQQKIECASKAYNASTPGLLSAGPQLKYSNWQEVSFDLSQYAGKQIELNFQALDCSASGHYGYAYLALRSDNCSGSFVSGQSVICNNSGQLTYSTPAIDGATFNWTLPTGWLGTSTSNSITVTPSTTGGTISVTPSQSCGNISTNSLSVTVANGVPADPGPITGLSSVCADGTTGSTNITYSIDAVQDATEYVWTLPTGWTIVEGFGTRTIKVNVSSTASSGNISVVAKNACGSSVNNSAQALSVVASQPSVGGSISPSSVSLSCASTNTLTISGNTGNILKWETSTNGGISWSDVVNSSGQTSVSVSPASSAFYRAVVQSGVCPTANSSSSLINVKSLPNIVTNPINRDVCSNVATSFTVAATGDDLIYQWYESQDGGGTFNAITNGGVYSGASTATLQLSSGINSTYNNYKYRVLVTSACDNVGVTSNTVNLGIFASASVSITTQPVSVTVTQGAATSVSVIASGPGLTYQWQSSSDNINFNNISGATNSIYRPSTTALGTTYLRAIVTSNACSSSANITSSTATLQVNAFGQNQNLPPVAINDTKILTGFSAETGNILTNDSDPENSSITITSVSITGIGLISFDQLVTIPDVGEFTISSSGTYTFTPFRSFSGSVPDINYNISDGTNTASAVLNISFDGDSDGDGVQNSLDPAPNNPCVWGDSANRAFAPSTAWNNADCDGDGTPNGTDSNPLDFCVGGAVPAVIPTLGSATYNTYFRNGDCDGDGISNHMETNITGLPLDTDGDGTPNYLDTDSDNDGILDILEQNIDSDKDGIADYQDLDSDNDGIGDKQERYVDTDGDGIKDYLDLDSDNDNIKDAWEAPYVLDFNRDDNYDGRIDKNGVFIDPNGNGWAEVAEGKLATDTDGDGTPDYLDLDSDNDCIPDSVELTADTDKDFYPNYRDKDSDGDGIPDNVEAVNCSNPIDTDKDGTPDYLDLDSDNDGIPDTIEKGADGNNPVDTDKDGTPDYRDLDSDNDGIPDTIEKGADGNNPVDTDKDGTPDYRDLDSDNDGIPDTIEKGANGNNPVDTDKDGTPDYRDLDSDNDGIPDTIEKGTDGNNPVDTDKDGTPDYRDLDSDNDGIPDTIEKGTDGNNPVDTDKDGTPDYRDLDSDNDGIPDTIEKGADGNNPVDTDKDGTPDYRDLDSDNDGIPDTVEKGPNGNTPIDTDKDGTPDYRDLDSDNDGIPDAVEKGPNGNNPVDTDKDGTPDYRDLDSDNDTIPDSIEKGSDGNNPVDTDKDGTPDFRDLDSDNDGISDQKEAGPNPSNPVDTDKDGIYDFRDLDSDNDGIPDATEDSLDFGNIADCDGDGIENRIDPDGCEVYTTQGISPNGDGKNDKLVIPGVLRYNNKLTIFNRWGDVVYEKENYRNDWGGEGNAGTKLLEDDGLLPDGTYYYVIDFYGVRPSVGSFIFINRTK